MKGNPKGALDTNVAIAWKRILKVLELLTRQSNERNSKSARDTKVIIEWTGFLKVRMILM